VFNYVCVIQTAFREPLFHISQTHSPYDDTAKHDIELILLAFFIFLIIFVHNQR